MLIHTFWLVRRLLATGSEADLCRRSADAFCVTRTPISCITKLKMLIFPKPKARFGSKYGWFGLHPHPIYVKINEGGGFVPTTYPLPINSRFGSININLYLCGR